MSTATVPATRPNGAMQQRQNAGQNLAAFLGTPAMKRKLAMALPKHLSADRMIRMALTAATRNPKLLECTPESVALSLLTASQLGLEVNGRDAHLVPYKNQCQLIPDYKGLIQLAYRSGIVRSIDAKAVFEADDFEYALGSDSHLHHVPCNEDDPGQLIYAWAMVRLQNGGEKFVVLNRRDIKRRMASSQTANRDDSPWRKHPEPMWCKSAVKELSKWMPQVAELSQFHASVDQDNSAELGVIDVTADIPASQPSKAAQLANEMRAERLEPEGDSVDQQGNEEHNDHPPFNPPTPEEVQQHGDLETQDGPTSSERDACERDFSGQIEDCLSPSRLESILAFFTDHPLINTDKVRYERLFAQYEARKTALSSMPTTKRK